MRRLLQLVLLVTFLLPTGALAQSPPEASQTSPAARRLIDQSPAQASLLQTDEPPGQPDTEDEPASWQAKMPGWIEPTWMLYGAASIPGDGLSLDGLSEPEIPSAPTTLGDWENGWAWACITPLGSALNASLGASLAASPPFDLAFQLAEYSTNLGLKLCAPVVYPPSDIEVDHNLEELDTCGYTFEQDRIQGVYKNFYGLTLPWGDIFPGNLWGDFGQPAILHWNTDVDVQLKNPGWTGIIEFPLGPGEVSADKYWLPAGRHDLVWRGDTLVNPADFILLYIPGIAWAKMSKIAKIAKYADTVKDRLDYGLLGLDLLLGEVLPSYPTGMFNEETQRLAITDKIAPSLSTNAPSLTVQALDPGGISREKYLSLLRRTLTVTDNCDDSPEIYAANHYSLPAFAPLGSEQTVNWVAEDNGPRSLNGELNSDSLNQTFTVVDTLAPIILAPPDIITETVSLPALLEIGNPATFDLADLNPVVSHNACSRPGVLCAGNDIRFPNGKTTIAWSATDEAGNSSTTVQLINVKSLGANHTPTAHSLGGANTPQAISYQPITITLTAQDPDQDPLWFKIEQQPGNGFFHSPLYPYFIQDYRLANFQNISFLDWCADPAHRQQYIPTNWPVAANFMAVADDGTVFVHDNGMVRCDQFGDVYSNYRLAVFRPDGTWEQITDSFDTKDIHVDFRNGFIYTTSTNVGSTFDWVRKFDLDLNLIEQTRIDYADVPIDSPKQAIIDPQGLIYVSNGFQYSGAAQLYVYKSFLPPSSNYLEPILLADYSLPGTVFVDLALDSENNLYASERDHSRVYKFSPAALDSQGNFTPGELIGWLGKCDYGPGCDITNGRSFGFSCNDATCGLNSGSQEYGSLPGQLNDPRGIAIDLNDILYVTDYNNLRVQRFTAQGYYAGQARSECDGSCFVLGDFGNPKQVTVNSSHFFVLDDNADLLHIFETTPLTRVDDHTANIVYQSDNNFVGTDSFSFRVTDGMANSSPADVEVQVSRNFRKPVANPVPLLTVDEDGSLQIPVSGYDPDEPLDTLIYEAGTLPENGTLGGDPTSPLYIPNTDFAGVDMFTIVASDGSMLSDPQLVTVTVSAINDIPSFPVEGDPVPQGFAFRLAGDFVSLSRFASFGAQDQPMQIGRGFSTAFSVNFYDPDDLDINMVSVDWGDGSPVEPEGKLLEDGTATGPLLSEGQTGGYGTITAKHVFDQNGSYTVDVCITDNVQVDADGNKSPAPASTTACKTIPVEVSPMADILLEIESSANPAPVGGDLTYSLTATNNPPDSGAGVTATGLVISYTLDSRLQFLGATSTQGTCSHSSGSVTCQVGTLTPGSSAHIEVNVQMGVSLEAGNVLSNQVVYGINEPDQADSKANVEFTTLVTPADFIVNIIGDQPDSDPSDGLCAMAEGHCTLRAAVEQANAQSGAQSISMADWQILLTSELVIRDDLNLTGLGADHTTIGGSGSSSLLRLENGASLSLTGLTLQGGYTDQQGGGLLIANGQATLDRVQLSGNYAQAGGGGIWNQGTLAIIDSTISGNEAESGAGGIDNYGTLVLSNSTISGNSGQDGGGIQSSGTATLNNATIYNNHASNSGGGLSGGTGNINLKNTLLAGNRAEVSGPNCSSSITSLGYNLIDDTDGCGFTGQPTDILGQKAGLLSLSMGGGNTQTQALVAGSPAVDAGSCELAADQRGIPRPVDGNVDQVPACDIGAYEFVADRLYLPLVTN